MIALALALITPSMAAAPGAGGLFADPPTYPDGQIVLPGPSLRPAEEVDGPHAIVNGTTTYDFENVVALFMSIPGYGDSIFCSGTLIAPDHVLTAAHCVEAGNQYKSWYGADLYVAFGGGDLYTSGVDDVIEWEFGEEHPQYDDRYLDNDIGIVRLKGSSSVTPAVLNDEAPSNAWYGDELTYVGFGVTTDNGWDSGTKRTADIDYAGIDEYFVYGLDPVYNLCSGDSGGAGFEQTADGLELAGVNSFVFQYYTAGHSCEGGGSGATRVDLYIDWISGYTTDFVTDWDDVVDPPDTEDTEDPPDDTDTPPDDTDPGTTPGGGGDDPPGGSSGSDDTGLEDSGQWVTVSRKVTCGCAAGAPLAGGMLATLGAMIVVPLRRRR